eukprot:2927431-Rhodomonas_salina.5
MSSKRALTPGRWLDWVGARESHFDAGRVRVGFPELEDAHGPWRAHQSADQLALVHACGGLAADHLDHVANSHQLAHVRGRASPELLDHDIAALSPQHRPDTDLSRFCRFRRRGRASRCCQRSVPDDLQTHTHTHTAGEAGA